MVRLLLVVGLAVGLSGCIVASPYGYAPAPGYGYAYAPAYYAAPMVGVGVGFGGGVVGGGKGFVSTDNRRLSADDGDA
ncbi:MAG: hypothetical protein CBARDCOR_3983 [uncultured Caballeronia sp.]|nr:MAG: hypothetical protein CBARDCOR_3983 [uncultured Caballeronia sp.]